MARHATPKSLFIWMNGEPVGKWSYRTNHPQQLTYADQWLASPRARPLSLSMPLGPVGTVYRGPLVERYFDNLLQTARPFASAFAGASLRNRIKLTIYLRKSAATVSAQFN